MTDEQINAAIANLCGVEVQPQDSFGFQGFSNIPDYCNDYNSMRDAMVLVAEQGLESVYMSFLHDVVDHHSWSVHWVGMRVRAEAFLRTLGKWEEVHG